MSNIKNYKIILLLILLPLFTQAQTLVHPNRISTTTGTTGQILKINSSGVYAPAADATGAGGGDFAWTATSWGGVAANSTSTLLLLYAGAVVSTSSIGNLTVGVLTATSTTASSTLDDVLFVQGQGTGLSLTNLTVSDRKSVV